MVEMLVTNTILYWLFSKRTLVWDGIMVICTVALRAQTHKCNLHKHKHMKKTSSLNLTTHAQHSEKLCKERISVFAELF